MHAATAAKILGQREVTEVELQAKCYGFEIVGIDQMPRGNTLIRFQLSGRGEAVERGPLNESSLGDQRLVSEAGEVQRALAVGTLWEQLGELRVEARKAGYNKSSWKRACT